MRALILLTFLLAGCTMQPALRGKATDSSHGSFYSDTSKEHQYRPPPFDPERFLNTGR